MNLQKIWLGRLQLKATEFKYEKIDKKLKEQFINGIKNQTVTAEIIRELTAWKDMSEVTSKQLLSRA